MGYHTTKEKKLEWEIKTTSSCSIPHYRAAVSYTLPRLIASQGSNQECNQQSLMPVKINTMGYHTTKEKKLEQEIKTTSSCRVPHYRAAVSYTLSRLIALQGSNQECNQSSLMPVKINTMGYHTTKEKKLEWEIKTTSSCRVPHYCAAVGYTLPRLRASQGSNQECNQSSLMPVKINTMGYHTTKEKKLEWEIKTISSCRVPHYCAAVGYTLPRLRASQGSNQECNQSSLMPVKINTMGYHTTKEKKLEWEIKTISLCRVPHYCAAVGYTLPRLRASQGSNQECNQSSLMPVKINTMGYHTTKEKKLEWEIKQVRHLNGATDINAEYNNKVLLFDHQRHTARSVSSSGGYTLSCLGDTLSCPGLPLVSGVPPATILTETSPKDQRVGSKSPVNRQTPVKTLPSPSFGCGQ